MKILSLGRVLNTLWLASVLILGGLTIIFSKLFVIILVLIFLILGFFITSLKCPKCGRPVYLKGIRNSQKPGDQYWSPFIAKKCIQCGTDLTKAQFEWKPPYPK